MNDGIDWIDNKCMLCDCCVLLQSVIMLWCVLKYNKQNLRQIYLRTISRSRILLRFPLFPISSRLLPVT